MYLTSLQKDIALKLYRASKARGFIDYSQRMLSILYKCSRETINAVIRWLKHCKLIEILATVKRKIIFRIKETFTLFFAKPGWAYSMGYHTTEHTTAHTTEHTTENPVKTCAQVEENQWVAPDEKNTPYGIKEKENYLTINESMKEDIEAAENDPFTDSLSRKKEEDNSNSKINESKINDSNIIDSSLARFASARKSMDLLSLVPQMTGPVAHYLAHQYPFIVIDSVICKINWDRCNQPVAVLRSKLKKALEETEDPPLTEKRSQIEDMSLLVASQTYDQPHKRPKAAEIQDLTYFYGYKNMYKCLTLVRHKARTSNQPIDMTKLLRKLLNESRTH